MPNLRVSFTNIHIAENGDFAGATWKFEMYVNGSGKSWHPYNVEDHTTYDLNGYTWELFVPNGGVLTVNTGGYEEDSPGFPSFDEHDQIDGINRRYTRTDNWGIGNQTAGGGGDGISYTINFVIELLATRVHFIDPKEWIKKYIENANERIKNKIELFQSAQNFHPFTRDDLEVTTSRLRANLASFESLSEPDKINELLTRVIRDGWEVRHLSQQQIIIARG